MTSTVTHSEEPRIYGGTSCSTVVLPRVFLSSRIGEMNTVMENSHFSRIWDDPVNHPVFQWKTRISADHPRRRMALYYRSFSQVLTLRLHF